MINALVKTIHKTSAISIFGPQLQILGEGVSRPPEPAFLSPWCNECFSATVHIANALANMLMTCIVYKHVKFGFGVSRGPAFSLALIRSNLPIPPPTSLCIAMWLRGAEVSWSDGKRRSVGNPVESMSGKAEAQFLWIFSVFRHFR